MPNRPETEAEYKAVASAARAETVLAASAISHYVAVWLTMYAVY